MDESRVNETISEVAYLHQELNWTNDQIATRLDKSAATVRRYLLKAAELGILVQTYHLSMRESQKADIHRRLFDKDDLQRGLQALSDVANDRLRSVSIVPVASFGEEAARQVAKLLVGVKNGDLRTIATAWGNDLRDTIGSLPQAFAREQREQQKNRGGDREDSTAARHIVRVLPARGELLQRRMSVAPTLLSRTLAKTLNGRDGYGASLMGVPAILPKPAQTGFTGGGVSLTADQLDMVIRQWYRNMPGVKKALDEHLRLLPVDGVLTSCGPAGPISDFTAECLKIGEFPEEEFSRLVMGDVAGILLPTPDLSQPDLRKLQAWQERWIGLDATGLDRAADKGALGVVLIAKDQRKADAAAAAVRQGYCNHLIVSEVLADRIKALL